MQNLASTTVEVSLYFSNKSDAFITSDNRAPYDKKIMSLPSLTILAFPVSMGFLILSFSGKKGLLYFFGLALGSIINFLREQLLAKKV